MRFPLWHLFRLTNIPDGINSNSTLNEEVEIYKFKEDKKKYDKKLKRC
jgi:hypothetical protein